MKSNIPVCPRCEGASVYVRKDKSLVCRRCGYDSRRGELSFLKSNIPVCPRCEGASVYVRKDKSLVCRRCGYDSRRDEYPSTPLKDRNGVLLLNPTTKNIKNY